MSGAAGNNLSRDKIRQLLAAIGSGAAPDTTQIEATEYDWRQPHYFSGSQLNKINDFTKKIAAIMAEKFAQLYHSDFNVTATSITQHFASELLDQISSSGQNDYYLAFGPDQKNLCGLISIPEQTAIAWVTQLLGDTEPERDTKDSASQEHLSKTLSQLEESLLFDIASAIVESLAISLRGYHDVQPAKAIVKGQSPIELGSRRAGSLPAIEEMCKIVFGIKKADPADEQKGSEVSFLIPCSRLAPLAGKTTEAHNKLSANDISKAILEHLQRMPVSVKAQLGAAVLSFEQIMDLSPSDILLLDKAIDEPVELIVEGQIVFRGQPAKSSGQHAVVITEFAEENPA